MNGFANQRQRWIGDSCTMTRTRHQSRAKLREPRFPTPRLTLPSPEAPHADESRTLQLFGPLSSATGPNTNTSFADVAISGIGGELARAAQHTLSGDTIGRIYAPNISDEWTEEVTDDAQRARGERSAELYWNVSTWNPYQVVLVQTQLTARDGSVTQTRRDAVVARTD